MKLTHKQHKDIIDAYMNGEKVHAIAARFKITPQYPGMLVKRAGLQTRPNGNPKKQVNIYIDAFGAIV